MKKNSRYESTYISNIITILFFSAIIAISVVASSNNGLFAYADTVYSFYSTVNPTDGSFKNGTTQDTIKKGLPEKVGILVTATTVVSGLDKTSEQIPWPDVAVVSWNAAPNEAYDPTKTTAQTLTWEGTISAGTIKYNNNTVKIDSAKKVTIKVNVLAASNTKPSTYPKLADGEFKQRTSSFGLSLDSSGSSIDKEDVGNILDHAYDNDAALAEGIKSIMDNEHNLSIRVEAKKLDSSSLSDDIKSALKKRAREFNDDDDDAEVGNYFDISIYVTDNGKVKEKLQITDPGETLSFSYKIPSDITKSSSSSTSTSSSDNVKIVKTIYKKRYYNVVRYHSSSADGVGMDYSTETTRTFDVSEFSTFATVYYDYSSTSSSKSTSSSSTRSSGGSSSVARGSSSVSRTGAGTAGTGAAGTGAASGGGTTGSKAPKTGDEFNAKLWIYFLVIGIVVALCSFILFQDTKDYYDEKKESNP